MYIFKPVNQMLFVLWNSRNSFDCFTALGMLRLLIWLTSFRLIKYPYSIIINPHLNVN